MSMDEKIQRKEHFEHTHQVNEYGPAQQVQERGHHDHEHYKQLKEHEQHTEHKHLEPHQHGATIYIDHEPYHAAEHQVSGADVRRLAKPPIGSDKDIFHAVSGKGHAIKMADDDVIDIDPREVKQGRHFFSAPRKEGGPTADQREMDGGPSHDTLAKMAYRIYVDEGCQQGHDVEHWLRAEGEIARGQTPVAQNAHA